MTDLPDVRFDDAGLVPGIVQDATDGTVLMVAYLDREALAATVETGYAHFWSRSRRRLWRKGETSGNVLAVVDLAADCDGDALLLRVMPAGPACHTGARSCFDDPGAPAAAPAQGFAGLERLWAVIADRAEHRPEGSYTARLLAGGVDAAGRKVLEEAGEVLLAAKDHAAGTAGDDRVAEEGADLLFHLLVLLAERGVPPRRVLEVLAGRAR